MKRRILVLAAAALLMSTVFLGGNRVSATAAVTRSVTTSGLVYSQGVLTDFSSGATRYFIVSFTRAVGSTQWKLSDVQWGYPNNQYGYNPDGSIKYTVVYAGWTPSFSSVQTGSGFFLVPIDWTSFNPVTRQFTHSPATMQVSVVLNPAGGPPTVGVSVIGTSNIFFSAFGNVTGDSHLAAKSIVNP